MHRALLLLIFFFCFKAQGQRLIQVHIPVNLSYTPNDFFLHFMIPFNKPNHLVYFGFGINRTIFQRRFYPELAYRYSRTIDLTENFHLVPYSRVSFDLLKVSDAGIHKWVNPELGLNLELGKFRRLGIGAGYMMLNEFWRQDKSRFYSRDFGLTANIYWIM